MSELADYVPPPGGWPVCLCLREIQDRHSFLCDQCQARLDAEPSEIDAQK